MSRHCNAPPDPGEPGLSLQGAIGVQLWLGAPPEFSSTPDEAPSAWRPSAASTLCVQPLRKKKRVWGNICDPVAVWRSYFSSVSQMWPRPLGGAAYSAHTLCNTATTTDYMLCFTVMQITHLDLTFWREAAITSVSTYWTSDHSGPRLPQKSCTATGRNLMLDFVHHILQQRNKTRCLVKFTWCKFLLTFCVIINYMKKKLNKRCRVAVSTSSDPSNIKLQLRHSFNCVHTTLRKKEDTHLSLKNIQRKLSKNFEPFLYIMHYIRF